MIASNTIRFDSARTQPVANAMPVSFTEVKQLLTLTLQSSLELDRVLQLFLQQSRRILPLVGLNYEHPSAHASINLGSTLGSSHSHTMQHEHEELGTLTLFSPQKLTGEQLQQLHTLLTRLIFPLRNALLYRNALRRALRDPLTGFGNRLALEQSVNRELALAKRTGQALSLLMVDIDHFKSVNDLYGHAVGDSALKSIANLLDQHLRASDALFRYGGEEFLILLPHTPAEQALRVAERLRLAIDQQPIVMPELSLKLSISLGCATLNPDETAEALQNRADAALYKAKQQGRNCLVQAL